MQIEIARVRKSAALDHILFVDVAIRPPGILIKGITYNLKLNCFFMPTHKTEGGKPFSPISFLPEVFEEFKAKFLELIQDEKIPKEKEEITDEQRKKILDQFQHRESKKNVQRGLSGPKTTDGPGKPQRG